MGRFGVAHRPSASGLLSNMLTDRLLKREGAVMHDFVRLILRTEHAEAYFIEPDNPELRLRFLKAMTQRDTLRYRIEKHGLRADSLAPSGMRRVQRPGIYQ